MGTRTYRHLCRLSDKSDDDDSGSRRRGLHKLNSAVSKRKAKQCACTCAWTRCADICEEHVYGHVCRHVQNTINSTKAGWRCKHVRMSMPHICDPYLLQLSTTPRPKDLHSCSYRYGTLQSLGRSESLAAVDSDGDGPARRGRLSKTAGTVAACV